ncbi:MAG: MBL fold metallo-hydrolase [Desulfobacteraceae bacterium]|jgi:metallo-beta-lactamase family protein
MKYPFDLIHLGGEKTVTGSCHLILLSGISIMVDCGLPINHEKGISLSNMPVKPSDIDYLFITHAHIDHIGRIPELVDAGFKGEIICTHATKALLQPMLEDGLSFSNRSEKEKQNIQEKIDELSWGFEYNETFTLKKGVTFKLSHAGHILGSCFIRFEFPDKTKGGFSVIFSGDLGNTNTPILPDPDKPDSCDLLILESTYGDRNHQDRSQRTEQLGSILNKALADNGKVFIPAFALGRTQELIYEIDRLKTSKTIGSSIPVFIDSPLGLEITKIYSQMNEFWDKESASLLKKGDHPLDFKNLYAVESHHHHQNLIDMPGPSIIIAGSGMLTGGRMVSHLEKSLDDPKNDVIFVGFQAKGTPGRAIVEQSRTQDGFARFNGHKIPINARIHVMSGFSAHTGQTGLLSFVAAMENKPENIKLVHGEPEAQNSLKNALLDCGYHVI